MDGKSERSSEITAKPVKVVSLMETVTHMVSMSLMAVYEDNTDVPVMSVSV